MNLGNYSTRLAILQAKTWRQLELVTTRSKLEVSRANFAAASAVSLLLLTSMIRWHQLTLQDHFIKDSESHAVRS